MNELLKNNQHREQMNNKLFQDIVANVLYPKIYYYSFTLHIGGVWPNFMMFGQTIPPFIFSF